MKLYEVSGLQGTSFFRTLKEARQCFENEKASSPDDFVEICQVEVEISAERQIELLNGYWRNARTHIKSIDVYEPKKRALIYKTQYWLNNDATVIIDGVAYTKPLYTKTQVRKAGEIMSEKRNCSLDEVIYADMILDNWRAAHSCPLQAARVTLAAKAKRIDARAITVQRLKRYSSIVSKLQRFPAMKLSTMQDIGGCRAIVKDLRTLTQLVESYVSRPPDSFSFVRVNDYVSSPKPDGYRSTHIIYKYAPKTPSREVFQGLQIEVQLRTRLQHAWATAVEVVSTFTDQNLKSGVGSDEWKRFFFLASALLVDLENHHASRTVFPDDARTELIGLWHKLEVRHLLRSFAHSLSVSKRRLVGADYVLLKLDATRKSVHSSGFPKKALQAAIGAYNLLEREFRDNPSVQVVLVQVDKMANLQKAYPNYYLDTTEFIRGIEEGLAFYEDKGTQEN